MSDQYFIDRLLTSGAYGEQEDPKTGKKYYFNKETREVTWNLKAAIAELKKQDAAAGGLATAAAPTEQSSQPKMPPPAALKTFSYDPEPSTKEPVSENPFKKLQNQPSSSSASKNPVSVGTRAPAAATAPASSDNQPASVPTSTEEISSTPASVPTKPRSKTKEELTSEAVASGRWKQIADYKGDTFYINAGTGETTGDLGLFLQIQAILHDGSHIDPLSRAVQTNHHQSTTPSPRTTTTPPHTSHTDATAQSVREQIEDFRRLGVGAKGSKAEEAATQLPDELIGDWTTVMVSGPDQAAAAKRLIQFLADRTGESAVMQTLRSERDAALAEVVTLKQVSRDVGEQKRRLAQEVEELQKALYYGMGNVARNYTPASIDYVDMAPLAHQADKGFRVNDHLVGNRATKPQGYTVNGPTTLRASARSGAGSPRRVSSPPKEAPTDAKKRSSPFFTSALPPWRLPNQPSSPSATSGSDSSRDFIAETLKSRAAPRDTTAASQSYQSSPLDGDAVTVGMELASNSDRISYLEKTVYLLQCHNRQLKEALDGSQTSKHLKENCGVCEILDPWKRLVVGTVGSDSYITNRLPSSLTSKTTSALTIQPRSTISTNPPSLPMYEHERVGSGTLLRDRQEEDYMWPSAGVGSRDQHKSLAGRGGYGTGQYDALGQALGATLGGGGMGSARPAFEQQESIDTSTHERDAGMAYTPNTHWMQTSANNHGSLADRGHQYSLAAGRGMPATGLYPSNHPPNTRGNHDSSQYSTYRTML